MSAGVIINSASLDRKLARFAALSSKSLREATEEGARRFVQNAIRNTPPMILRSTPAAAKREWTQRVTKSFTTHRVTKKGYMKDAELRRLLAAKKRKEAEAATRKHEAQLAILQAEIDGDKKRMQYLKDEQRVAELTAQYRRQGLADAEAAARRMVAAEIEAAAVRDKAGKKEEARAKRMTSSWIQSPQASVGGGGRSYLVGGEAILAESRKQTTGIIQCRDRIDRLRSTPIKVEVTSTIGQ